MGIIKEETKVFDQLFKANSTMPNILHKPLQLHIVGHFVIGALFMDIIILVIFEWYPMTWFFHHMPEIYSDKFPSSII